MNASLSSQSHLRGTCSRNSWVLFCIGTTFWPFLGAVTAVELRCSLGWFSPSNRFLWMPLAVLAFLCSGIAPLIGRLHGPRKIIAFLFSLGAYGIAFFITLLIGIRYLHWYD